MTPVPRSPTWNRFDKRLGAEVMNRNLCPLSGEGVLLSLALLTF